MLFVLESQLCEKYHALSPFDVEQRKYIEIIDLYADVRRMQMREEKVQKILSDPNRVIRRKADDSWF